MMAERDRESPLRAACASLHLRVNPVSYALVMMSGAHRLACLQREIGAVQEVHQARVGLQGIECDCTLQLIFRLIIRWSQAQVLVAPPSP